MSYTPTTWNTGDTITASALNKIEQGIADGGGGGATIITDSSGTLDKTYAEIYNLVNSGTPCYVLFNANGSSSDLDSDYNYFIVLLQVISVFKYNDVYRIFCGSTMANEVDNISYLGTPAIWTYQASVSSGYPTFLRTVPVASNAVYADSNQIV